MPDQASLGAGVLQTAMRLSISLGLAATAAVYGTTSKTPAGSSDVNLPYERAFLCSIIFAVVGTFFISFMHIGTQGAKCEIENHDELLQNRPPTAGEYSDRVSREHRYGYHDGPRDHHSGHGGSSTLTVDTMATIGSQESFFPRWSWEGERQWRDDRFRGSKIVYEVCIKCLEERRVVVAHDTGGIEEGWQQDPVETGHIRPEEEDMQIGYARVPDDADDERHWRRERDDQDSGQFRLHELARHSRRDTERQYAPLPDLRREPRPRPERAWQRFPVKPTRQSERGDISQGGDGWL
jgi:hypothetical protein